MSNSPPSSIHAAFTAAFNAGDLEALVALYEPSAVLLSGSPLSGHDAIREAYRGFLAMMPQIQIETLNALETSEGLALLHGRWAMQGTGEAGEPIQMEGRNTEVVRRQADGRWLFVIDNPYAP